MNHATAPHNVAAWSLRKQQRPLVVTNAPYSKPPKDHVAIKVHCVAINPIDWIMQDSDLFNLHYPAIFGLDIAGEIHEVGEGVNGVKVGQRVIAHGNSYSTSQPRAGAFQKYTIVPAHAIAELSPDIGLSRGVVLPLGISTAAAGLYQPDFLALPLPSTTSPWKPLGRSLLIWGGSSSVGSCAIQLAVASGARVVTTASPRNAAYCRSLGASAVFDYHAADVEDQLVDHLLQTGLTVAGAYHAVGADGAVQSCARIVERCRGKSIVVSVRGVPDSGIPGSVRVKAISSGTIFNEGNAVGPYIWREFLPDALAQGTIVTKPDPLVVGEELRSVQLGLDVQKRGVSAKKVVVTKISG